jgi:hypothetical protein
MPDPRREFDPRPFIQRATWTFSKTTASSLDRHNAVWSAPTVALGVAAAAERAQVRSSSRPPRSRGMIWWTSVASAPHSTQRKRSRRSVRIRIRLQARVLPRRLGCIGHGSAFGHDGTEQMVNARGIARR